MHKFKIFYEFSNTFKLYNVDILLTCGKFASNFSE